MVFYCYYYLLVLSLYNDNIHGMRLDSLKNFYKVYEVTKLKMHRFLQKFENYFVLDMVIIRLSINDSTGIKTLISIFIQQTIWQKWKVNQKSWCWSLKWILVFDFKADNNMVYIEWVTKIE